MTAQNEGNPVSIPPSPQGVVEGEFTPTNFLDTAASLPPKPTNVQRQDACLVQIYPIDQGLGTRFILGETTVVIGREPGNPLPLNDPAVSRRHAEIRPATGGHFLIDLQSTNGTFVNDRPATTSRLSDGDYIRIGTHIFRYLSGDNVEMLYHEEIYRLTIIDGLTGIHNQRYFQEFLDRELSRSAPQRPLALVMFDIDHFKTINDRLGHLGGDHVLRELTATVQKLVRKEDLLARYGGEEFAFVMPETSLPEASNRAELIRRSVEQHHFNYADANFLLTVSLGIAVSDGNELMSPVELIRRADEKLYHAKNAGRNCMMA